MRINAAELTALGQDIDASAGNLGAAASTVVRKAAMDMQRFAQAKAPVDTGTLRGSISTDITGDGRFGSMTVEVGPTVEYGAYVELGTSRMAPQPYLGPAFDAVVPGLAAALSQAAGRSFGVS